MRVDLKRVKGRSYLQFVDKRGIIHHLGSVEDFNSWLLSLILWNLSNSLEYLEKRKEFFESMETKARQYIELDSEKRQTINDVFHGYDVDRHILRLKKIHVPKASLFGQYKMSSRGKRVWITNEWGKNLQKRLDEVYAKQRREGKKRSQKPETVKES